MKISLIHSDNVDANKKLNVNAVQDVVDVDNVEELSYYALNAHIALATFGNIEFNPLWTQNEYIVNACSGSTQMWKYLSNVEQTQFLSFDFDSGKHRSSDIHIDLEGYNHVILGSKNHLKDKGDGKGPIERFHIFIPTIQRITDCGLYKYIIQTISKVAHWEIDKACMEASHYYFKHSQELFVTSNGKDMDITRFVEHKEKEEDDKKQKEFYRRKLRAVSPPTSAMDIFRKTKYYEWLTSGEIMSDGNRYAMSSQIIGGMIKCGLSLDECMDLFNQYATYGTKFTEKSVIQRYEQWS